MSLRPSLYVLGILLLLLSGSMGVVLLWNIYEVLVYGDLVHYQSFQATFCALVVGLVISMNLIFLGDKNLEALGLRESFFIVTFAWFLGGAVGALPFFFWAHFSGNIEHEFSHYVNCYFEIMSGLTTSGVSVLSAPASLPQSILFWRALVQWLGGLGIVVLFVAVIPMIAAASKKILSAETSGIGGHQDTPSLQETAQILWIIYAVLTILQILVMKVSDFNLPWFTCLTFALSTTPTSGLSILNDSAGSLSVLTQWVIIFFMFISGINYALFYHLLRGKWRIFWNNSEFRVYLGTVFLASLVVGLNLKGASYFSLTGEPIEDPSFARILLDSFFQVISVQTTTGFSNVDSNSWPDMARYILFLLMFVGGCAGSTAGGVKIVRIIAFFKMLFAELERSFRPNVVRPCSIDGGTLSHAQKHSILLHIMVCFFLVGFGSLLLFFLEGGRLDFITAISSLITCFSNVGFGFSKVGATSNFGFYSDGSKLLLLFMMVVGRLEVFTVLALFSRRFWKF